MEARDSQIARPDDCIIAELARATYSSLRAQPPPASRSWRQRKPNQNAIYFLVRGAADGVVGSLVGRGPSKLRCRIKGTYLDGRFGPV